MTTASWVSVIDHTSNAAFRAWGSELKTKFLEIGLVQSADTGQINWTTVNKPAANVAAGFEIYYLNDSLHGSASIYLKIEYGTGSLANWPSVWITVGTGSNGSGTLTGQLSSRNLIAISAAPASVTIPYTSYACASEGQVNLLWKANGTSNASPMGWFSLERTCDNSGNMTAIGFRIMTSTGSGSTYIQCVRTAASAATYAVNSHYGGVVSNNVAASDDGAGNKQVYLQSGIEPACRTLHSSICVFASEFPLGTFFTVTIPGFATPRTFLSWANNVMGNCMGTGSSTHASAKLWQ